jgi:hypothetical protein
VSATRCYREVEERARAIGEENAARLAAWEKVGPGANPTHAGSTGRVVDVLRF